MSNIRQLSDYVEAVLRAKGISSWPVPANTQANHADEIYFKPLEAFSPFAFQLDQISHLLAMTVAKNCVSPII